MPLAIVAALLAAGAVVTWQLRERLSSAEAAVKDEVIASFHLVRAAEADGDIELFRNLLSGSDLEWANAQLALFDQGRLFDLGPLGLGTEPESLTSLKVTLSPELNSAEVSAIATYVASIAEGGAVRLRQTSVYRHGERWIWSPPRVEFWGPELSSDGRFLQVFYPQRDERLASRLAEDLDDLVEKICAADVRLECPEDLKLFLNFSSEPTVMVEMNERFAAAGLFGSRLDGRVGLRRNQPLTLPTPSLLGEPADDTSYQALLKGYGAHLAMLLAGRYVDPACCGTEARLRAATRELLFDLDLMVWSPAEEAGAGAAARAEFGQAALLCSAGFERAQKLFVLDLAGGEWQEQALAPDLLSIRSMPDGDGVLLLGRLEGEDGPHSQVWMHVPGGSRLLVDLPVTPAEAAEVSWEVLERQALLVVESPDVRRGYSRYYTIDLAQCRQGDCAPPPQSTVSRPVWSPDGSQMIVRAYGLLWWRIGDSMVPIAEGTAPFWVSEQSYGYARSVGREQALVVVNTAADNEEEVVLTSADLREALARLDPGSGSPGNRLLFGRVLAGDPWRILAFEVDRDGRVRQAMFFAFDLASGTLDLLPHIGRLLSYNVTPSGEQIAVGGFVEEEGRWQITITGRQGVAPITTALPAGGSADAAPSYSWSHDETWLMILEQGALTLVRPDTGDVVHISPPQPGCVQAAWYSSGGAG